MLSDAGEHWTRKNKDRDQGRSQKLHVGGAWCGTSETVAGSPYTPPLPPRFPLRLVYTQKYLNVFECTQPYFVLLQETLNFFLCSLGGGLGPPGPPLATPLHGDMCTLCLKKVNHFYFYDNFCECTPLINGFVNIIVLWQTFMFMKGIINATDRISQ